MPILNTHTYKLWRAKTLIDGHIKWERMTETTKEKVEEETEELREILKKKL